MIESKTSRKRLWVKIDLIKLAIVALTIKVMCSNSILLPWNSFLDNFCVVIGVLVFVKKICDQYFKVTQLVLTGLLGMLVLYTGLTIKQYDLMISFITIYILMNENLDEYIEMIFRIEVLIVIFHVLLAIVLSLAGMTQNYWIITGSRIRFNGGFTHPNVLASLIFSCMMMYVWRYFGNISIKKFIGLLLTAVGTFALTKSRTSFLLNILLLIFIYLGQRKQMIFEYVLNKSLRYIFPILSCVIYWAQKNYQSGNQIIQIMDNLLTGRIKYAAYAYETSGLTWLPRYLDYADTGVVSWDPVWNLNTFTFDNVYSFMYMELGIIWIIVFSILIFAICNRIDYKCKMFLLILILYFMTEIHGLNCIKFFPGMLFVFFMNENGDINEYEKAVD